MEQKFELGLFENPYVDVSRVAGFVGNAQFQAIADKAQRSALVLLENKDGFLPLQRARQKVWLYGVDANVAQDFGYEIATSVETADFAVIKASAPFAYGLNYPQQN